MARTTLAGSRLVEKETLQKDINSGDRSSEDVTGQ